MIWPLSLSSLPFASLRNFAEEIDAKPKKPHIQRAVDPFTLNFSLHGRPPRYVWKCQGRRRFAWESVAHGSSPAQAYERWARVELRESLSIADAPDICKL